MSAALYLLVLLSFSFFLRLLSLAGKSTDDYGHLWMTARRAEARDLRQHPVPDTPLEGIRGYPPLSHFIVSLFPRRHWTAAGKILNITYDCLSVAVVYGTSSLFMKDRHAFALAMVYSTTPVLFPLSARLKSMGARTLGGLLYNLFIVAYGAYMFSSNKAAALACVVLVLLSLLSSQFAMQNLLWSCLFLSLWQMSMIPLLLFAAGLGLFLLPPFGGIALLRRKFHHYRWYVDYLRRGEDWGEGVRSRNRLRDLVELPSLFVRDRYRAFIIITRQNSYLIAAYSLPVAYVAIFGLLSGKWRHGAVDGEILGYAAALSVSAAAAFLVTSTRRLLFLGQGERYFEYGAFPLTFLGAAVLLGAPRDPFGGLFTLLAVNLAVVLALLSASVLEPLQRAVAEERGTDTGELVTFLQGLESPRIITLPTKYAFQLSCLLGGGAEFYYDNVCHPGRGIKYMSEEHVVLHYFKPDFGYFAGRYGIDTFVFRKENLRLATSRGIDYRLEDLGKVFENGTFWVGRIQAPQKSSVGEEGEGAELSS